jgi:hypothetical protein
MMCGHLMQIPMNNVSQLPWIQVLAVSSISTLQHGSEFIRMALVSQPLAILHQA